MADYISNYSGPEIDQAIASISAINSTTVTGNGITANLYKYGRIVFCTIQTNLSSAVTANDTILTIPEGYRPISVVEVDSMYQTTKERFRIQSSGKFDHPASDLASGFLIRLSATWISSS